MNVFKIGLALLTMAGFSFGVDKLVKANTLPDDREEHYEHMDEGFCHGNGDFLEHMLTNLTEEETVLVENKIDDLLLEYNTTLEELEDDLDVRYDFMLDLMNFLDENGIDYHNHDTEEHYHDDDDHHNGMGMH
jgi:hypothetical protein